MKSIEPFANAFIEFNRDPAEYASEDILEGLIVIHTSEKVLVSNIEVNICARTNLRWIDEETGVKNGKKMEHFSMKLDLFENYFELLDLDGQLLVGRHEIPFKFALPNEIPENFECELGWTRYSCVAKIFGQNGELLQDCRALFSVQLKDEPPMRKFSLQHFNMNFYDHDRVDAQLKNIEIY